MKKAIIVGAGLSGITAAILLRNKGYNVEIFETRKHIGGNCYDVPIFNTYFHVYGPHIFHTNDEEVFDFLSKYTEWTDFKLRPMGNTDLGLISLPYSKKTILEIGRRLSQEEIIKYIFKEYSEKQWGVPFDQIPTSITNRIPKTQDCENPTWFEGEKYQCIPSLGYTKMMENMLSGIVVHLQCNKMEWKKYSYDILVFTGKIDEYFNYIYEKLPYRSLEFIHQISEIKMNTFIINQNILDVPYTRKYDHSFFSPNHSGQTIITKEYSIAHNDNNIPFYPIIFGKGNEIYLKYKELAEKENNIIFAGRLATYKYLDMWMAIKQVMIKLKNF
jgi:UDP-galactopyranose mutase